MTRTEYKKVQARVRENARKMAKEPFAKERLLLILAKWRIEDRKRARIK